MAGKTADIDMVGRNYVTVTRRIDVTMALIVISASMIFNVILYT